MKATNAGYIQRLLETELGVEYAKLLMDDQNKLIELYEYYEGTGQRWQTKSNLDYEPTKRITNLTRSIVDREARFMFARPPEIKIAPEDETADESIKQRCKELERIIGRVLKNSGWRDKLPKAGRDALIGKRVALKITGGTGKKTRVQFRPALEFFHDYALGDAEQLQNIIFLYQQNHEAEAARQRIWIQQYKVQNGAVLLTEGLYDGNGIPQGEEIKDKMTRLSRIPVSVIINDGLTGDVLGRSDVAELQSLADGYNRGTSDDTDALRFNMFPARVFTDAAEECLSAIKVAPGAMIDLQTNPTNTDGQAKCDMLESTFSYSDRVEAYLDRITRDMHQLLDVPEISIDDLKALGVSGKAMRAMYWPLITRCEEKWSVWDTALEEMASMIAEIEGYGDLAFVIQIEHLYPIMEDENEERANDLQEVRANVCSRTAYIDKWKTEDGQRSANEAIQLMGTERQIQEDAYWMPDKGGGTP